MRLTQTGSVCFPSRLDRTHEIVPKKSSSKSIRTGVMNASSGGRELETRGSVDLSLFDRLRRSKQAFWFGLGCFMSIRLFVALENRNGYNQCRLR